MAFYRSPSTMHSTPPHPPPPPPLSSFERRLTPSSCNKLLVWNIQSSQWNAFWLTAVGCQGTGNGLSVCGSLPDLLGLYFSSTLGTRFIKRSVSTFFSTEIIPITVGFKSWSLKGCVSFPFSHFSNHATLWVWRSVTVYCPVEMMPHSRDLSGKVHRLSTL